MVELINERVCAEVEGDVVVFLIGMRINKLWKVWKWLPVVAAMPKMVKELSAHPELGMLSSRKILGLRNLAFFAILEKRGAPASLRACVQERSPASVAGLQQTCRHWRRRGHLARNLCRAQGQLGIGLREHAALWLRLGWRGVPGQGTARQCVQTPGGRENIGMTVRAGRRAVIPSPKPQTVPVELFSPNALQAAGAIQIAAVANGLNFNWDRQSSVPRSCRDPCYPARSMS